MHRGEGDDLLTFVKKKSENKNKYKTQLPKEGNMKFHKIKKRKKKKMKHEEQIIKALFEVGAYLIN